MRDRRLHSALLVAAEFADDHRLVVAGGGHTSTVYSVAFGTVDGRPVLASASSDETVRLWDPATGAAIGEPLIGHTNTVNSMAFGVIGERSFLAAASGPHIYVEVLGPPPQPS
ncbi:MAG: hypothetical protein GY925_13905 [Actinomycetia bacterium]|nr:hypothetical protein [Actinomycetes bacterium]